MEKYICIHGHFYQPPRESPWLEAIELQDSAYPYHDWNERITAECYGPNATSRILDEKDRILQIVNNYNKISFDFGPTLLTWMEKHAPGVYEAVLEADRKSQGRFSGHGSALAQAYNHMILPLANREDKYTQVLWGIRDFEHRFGRKPEGMWLPETAVDLDSLEVLVELGMHFTILAPHQAGRVRSMRGGAWRDVGGGKIDPTMPYIQHLPSGRDIVLFFYDAPVSRAVAFEGLLSRGESFAQRLLAAFRNDRTWPQIVHIATDGESYGHHHRFGDMALAYAIHYIESNNLARLTNYGEYLERHAPTHEVEIVENTSWSCSHGVERWRADCGCQSGKHPVWHQQWRGPLRRAFDWLRETLVKAYQDEAKSFLEDPVRARNDYIAVLLDRSPARLESFFRQHVMGELDEARKVTVLKLLELRRHGMFMYTSCGWFFDELSGIETLQVMQYAGRAMQLYQEVSGYVIEGPFLELLEKAKSNVAEHENGRRIYEKLVKPAIFDLEKVAAHYAMSSLFKEHDEPVDTGCYEVTRDSYQAAEAGQAKLAVGRIRVVSKITWEAAELSFGVLHWGDHNISGCVKRYEKQDPYQDVVWEVMKAFAAVDFPKTLELLEDYFGPSRYSVRDLFRDEQRTVLNVILASSLEDVEAIYHQVHKHNAALLRFLKEIGVPKPKVFQAATDFVLNADLRRAFEAEPVDLRVVENLLEVAKLEAATLDTLSLEMAIRKRIEEMAGRLTKSPRDFSRLEQLNAVAGLLPSLPFQVNLTKAQNVYYGLLQTVYPQILAKTGQKSRQGGRARQWIDLFRALGEKLSVRVG